MLKRHNYSPIYTEVNAFVLELQKETLYTHFDGAEKLGYHIYEL